MHKNTIETSCTVAQIIVTYIFHCYCYYVFIYLFFISVHYYYLPCSFTTPIPKKLECCGKCNQKQNAII